jgi:hypothetical protein
MPACRRNNRPSHDHADALGASIRVGWCHACARNRPGTDLYFCPLSGTREKVTRLKNLFSRLTLPDGTNFPPGSVELSIDPV